MSALPMPQVPRADNAIYSDEYIERWGRVFVAGGYVYRGITFMQVLARPHRYPSLDAPQPLLPKQMRVRTRVIDAELQASRYQYPRHGEPLDLSMPPLPNLLRKQAS